MTEDLQCLKNLGKTSVQWLKAAGVQTPSDLRRLGAVQAYLTVKARGFRATKVLLFAIEGACWMLPGERCRTRARRHCSSCWKPPLGARQK